MGAVAVAGVDADVLACVHVVDDYIVKLEICDDWTQIPSSCYRLSNIFDGKVWFRCCSDPQRRGHTNR